MFGLEDTSAAMLTVYDVAGRHVRTLAQGTLAAGTQVREWDGRDTRGRPVTAGIYLVRLTAFKTVLTEKIVLVK